MAPRGDPDRKRFELVKAVPVTQVWFSSGKRNLEVPELIKTFRGEYRRGKALSREGRVPVFKCAARAPPLLVGMRPLPPPASHLFLGLTPSL